MGELHDIIAAAREQGTENTPQAQAAVAGIVDVRYRLHQARESLAAASAHEEQYGDVTVSFHSHTFQPRTSSLLL